MDAQRHDEAISHYTTALSLNPASPQGVLIKRTKAWLAAGSSQKALDDANQVRPLCHVQLKLVDASSSDDLARSIVTVGLRDEACGFTQGRRL